MWNSSINNPSPGDGHGRLGPLRMRVLEYYRILDASALAWEPGDYLCLFPGKTENEAANI